MATKFTVKDFQKKYSDDDVCLHEVLTRRYGNLEACPDCGCVAKFHRIKSRKCYSCQHCAYQIYPLVGTVFEGTKTPLSQWFYAFLLFSLSKNGVSAKELQRHLGVTYKCAFRIGHAIRSLMNEKGEMNLSGVVECDETLVGGRTRGGKRGWGAKKPCVFGMVERGGNIITYVVPNRKAETLYPIIVNHTAEDVTMCTDDFSGYSRLHREVGQHLIVSHTQKQWVNGEAHTQTIDGFWSLFKRSVRGTYTSISPKYTQNYLDEFNWRYNRRGKTDIFQQLIEKAEKAG